MLVFPQGLSLTAELGSAIIPFLSQIHASTDVEASRDFVTLSLTTTGWNHRISVEKDVVLTNATRDTHYGVRIR